ncbi:hypothetical protein SAMN05216344_13618 [Polaromonas sp. OV174]|uniref:hypothetical protein n=1 Tax=Polaromonas sp. OV174 TaxID=1855300 RepID=UPI0008F2ADC3|nr:hypothetical protein [Polaromonas sp. OV174]SFC73239.1 hypothetical protein SAMN05216344_13618 [Polaromonas sp. OV174]
MSEIDRQGDAGADVAKAPISDSHPIASPSRRRLIKLGTAAVPVVATLTSRPAFAWSCLSPSAWGSELINPNTSLKNKAGHQSYPNEAWYISDWRDNLAQSAAGYTNAPWSVLNTKYPSLYDKTTKTNGKFDYTKVTIKKLLATVPGLNAANANGQATVKEVLTSGSPLQKSAIVAQLNYLLLSPLSGNELEKCFPPGELQKMASGSYSPSGLGVTWDSTQITKYLFDNWIAR